MSYLKDREIWLSNVPTGNPPVGYFWKFIQNGKVVVRDSSGNNQMMVATSGSQAITGSLTVTGGITGTVSSASYVEYSNVANKPTLISGSSQVTYSGLTGIPSGIVSGSAQIASFGIFATTGSNGFNGNQSITGSLTVTGQVVAQTLNVQQVTSSIVYSSGSNVFGNSLANTQQFTGSVSVTGSFAVTTTGTELQVTSTGVNLGNALTDSHIISGSLRVNPNGLFVSGSGIVGVGTILPSERFEVNTGQGARAGMALTGEYPYLRFNVSSSSANARNWAFNATNAEPGDFALLQSTSKDGNPVTAGTSILGFGRTGAATFSSSVTAKSMKIENTGTASFLYFNNTSIPASNYIALGSAANELFFQVNGSDRMIIKSDGKVGIGLTSPTGQLSIKNQISNGSNPVSSYAATSGVDGQNFFNGYYAENSDGLGPYPRYFDIVSTGSPDGSNGGSNIRFFTNPVANNSPAAERMRITSNGDIFVYGTTAQLRLNTSSNISTIQFWKDSTPTFASNIGNAVPGNSVTNDLIFSTYDTSINWNERMRITSNGYLRMASGTGGIQFNGDTAAANALDDYEEGTWTPTSESGGLTLSVQVARYTKVGRLVTAQCYVSMATGGNSNPVIIGGLPFTNLSNGWAPGALDVSACSRIGGVARVAQNSTNIGLIVSSGSTSLPRFEIQGNEFGNDSYIILTVTYQTS